MRDEETPTADRPCLQEGGKDCMGEPIRLATYRQHQREADEEYERMIRERAQ